MRNNPRSQVLEAAAWKGAGASQIVDLTTDAAANHASGLYDIAGQVIGCDIGLQGRRFPRTITRESSMRIVMGEPRATRDLILILK